MYYWTSIKLTRIGIILLSSKYWIDLLNLLEREENYSTGSLEMTWITITSDTIWIAGITDVDEKQMCLQLAEEVCLDIPQITKTVVENIRNRSGGGLAAGEGLSLDVTVTEVGQRSHWGQGQCRNLSYICGEIITWLTSADVLSITFCKGEYYLQRILQDITLHQFEVLFFPLYNQSQSSHQQFIKKSYL